MKVKVGAALAVSGVNTSTEEASIATPAAPRPSFGSLKEIPWGAGGMNFSDFVA